MASTDLPSALERRELLYGKPRRAPDYHQLSRRYLDAKQHGEAVEFALRIPDESQRRELLRQLRDLAVSMGDWFLLNRLHGVEPLEDKVWEQGLEKAQAAGKLRYALKIARVLKDEARVAALELQLGLRAPETSAEGGLPADADADADAESEA